MNLKAYLAEIGVSLKDLARILDYDPRYLSHVMHGHTKPSIRLSKEIEKLTNGEVKIKPSLKTKVAREAYDEEVKKI